MKKLVMLVALILGTSVMVNANTIPLKKLASKEVAFGKHKKHRKAKQAKTEEVAKTATQKK
jgi:hypothetical protein